MSSSERGFSFIELVLMAAIILIVAALAIPNLLRSRIAANESAAIGSLRAINTAASAYKLTYHNGFPTGLRALGTPGPTPSDGEKSCAEAQLIDDQLTRGMKSGYNFTYEEGSGDVPNTAASGGCAGWNNYTINADPVTPGTSGQRHFYSDQSGVIRSNSSAVAGPTDEPVQ
jgi:type IV pilus assembly protein PilA